MGQRARNSKLEGHRERLRQKFLDRGIEALTDEELLELLLTLGTPRRDCKPMARAAIKRFGSLRHVLEAPSEQLLEIPGVGPRNSLALKLVHGVARRFLEDRLEGMPYKLGSSQEVFEYLYHSMRDLKREVFKVLFLDSQNRILKVEDMFQGTINTSAVYPREVIRRALEVHAAAMVTVHNHPSGDPKPSQDDIRITRDLVMAARVMGMRLLDHLIIGEGTYSSLAELGHIERFQEELDRKGFYPH
ncbi:MAG: DNA repair protein RadC [bacterium]